MTSIVQTLTPEQINLALQQAQAIANTATPVVQPNQFTFFAGFDGTNNDRNDLAQSGDPQMTNAAQLFEQVDSTRSLNRNLGTGYYAGPGADGTLPASEVLSPLVTQQVINTANRAYNEFAFQAAEWLDTNPGGSVTTMVTAFSRGGATAAVFSQLLYEKGLVDPRSGAVLIPPGQVGISAGLIYDPVDTGVNGNLAFAPNVENITVIRAANEYRYLFRAADYSDQPGITTLDFTGNHCDTGGCYDNGIGALTLQGGTEFFRNSGLTIADVPLLRQFDPTRPVVVRSEGVDEFGNRVWDEYGSVGEGTVRLRQYVGSPASVQYLDDGTQVTTFIGANGQLITETLTVNLDGTVTRSLQVSAMSPNGAMDLKRSLATVGDALTLIKAIQTGAPLPITVSGLRVLSDFNPGSSANLANYNLAGAAQVGSGILSLLSLDAALKRGDTLGALTAGAQTVGFAASAYVNFAKAAADIPNATIVSIDKFVNGEVVTDALGRQVQVPGALPYLSLVNSIANGDATGVAVASLGIMGVPYIGQIYAIYSIITSLFGADEIPDPWGSGQFVWNGNQLAINAAGETGGLEAVSGFMNQVQATMNTLVAQVQRQNPGSTLGLIANRMPTLGYDMSGFRYTNIDPLTGVETNPAIRYDTSGRPYNATPGTPESFQSMGEAYIRNALERGAIAPQWEVETAALQTRAGDPNAGLTEEERAGRAGNLAAAPAGATQTWRPVMLDLNGDGMQTVAKAQSGVAFDVDDSGFLKQTDWINAQDAFLVLDRNVNGSTDASRELFSNGDVGLNRRGVAGLAWTDSNYDGRIDALDPVFSQLELWQDGDGNGAADAGERVRLAQAGITSLNYAMGTFEQNGVTRQMASPDLQADTAGQRINVIPEGMLVENTGGQISLLVTRVDDRTQVQANRDGITVLEDIEAIVDASSLLTNDTFGGFRGRDLALTAVQNVRRGTAFVDANNFVHFQPEANYYGSDAGFDYVVTAPNGQSAVASVDVIVNGVNDAPVVSGVRNESRPIYGYRPVYNYYEGYLIGQEPVYEPFMGSDFDGRPVYYGTPVAYDDPGTGQVVANDVDDPVSSLQYQIIGNPQFGAVTIDAAGRFQYTGWQSPNTPSGPRLDTDEERIDSFQVQVTDPYGASTTQVVNITHYGPYTPPTPPGGGGKHPIALDLDRNGFSFTGVDDSNVFFDVNGDGWKHKISWIKPGDGLLVYDANGNGVVDDPSEISFARYAPNAQSDLERLRAFDSNNDGKLSSLDEQWGKFGAWQDANSNGVVDAGELQTLDQRGVASLSLTSDNQFAVVDGNTIRGVAQAMMTDGTTLNAADVTLAYSNEVRIPGTTNTAERPPFSPSGEEIIGTDDNDLILGKTGNTIIRANAGNDVVFAGDGNDVIEPGAGNDVVYAGGGNDIVMPGTGNDVVYGGLGSDLILGGGGDNALLGEGGNDVVFAGNGNDVVDGGAGNDALYAGGGDDTVSGGSGNDAMFGAEGDDSLTGNAGHDRLDGGSGNDLLDGGEGVDTMAGGAGDDTYRIDDASDAVTENANEGNDTVRASVDYRLGANVENVVLTGSGSLTATGNALANVLTANSGNSTLIGGAGDDRYVVKHLADVIQENAGEGNDVVLASVGYALSDNVEALTLTGASDINATGNAGDNVLIGNGGDNVLDGGAGADRLAGGVGDDAYQVDNLADAVIENPGAGRDTVFAAVGYAVTANVENLTLTGGADIAGTGNELDNLLTGNSGNNALDGGAGADAMFGGAGDDIYHVDNLADMVVEDPGAGSDSVFASISYALTDNVEALTLTGSADLDGTGNALDNVITGNGGNNVLDGGAGADSMSAGAGDDTYQVDNLADVVVENPGEGSDSVFASVDHALSDNVENLTLTGIADIDATGNALNNILSGNGGSNVLDGAGGADAMAGGAGSDTYVVDNAADAVVENAVEGTDTVLASISYALSGNVENLTLTGVDGVSATGNELDNIIKGNSGNNLLDGGGGADDLIGGAGDDTYVVDHDADTIAENPNEGTDLVFASVSYVLSANVEHLTLTGAANTDGTGNDLGNTLIGNNGNNVLDGAGGVDTMIGGQGDDAYVVDDVADGVIENPAEGIDTVLASVSFVLPENVENLVMTGTGGNAGGNALDNRLTGNGGNNLLDGGAGVDTMIGGRGDDTYIVDNMGDVVVENPNEGNDTIVASVSYALSDNVENLALTGNANLQGAGNGLNNVMMGNSGDNMLVGHGGNDTFIGGAGNDTLIGGSGNDTYIYNLDDGLDRIADAGGVNKVQFGAGLSLANVAIRLTTLSGDPYPVRGEDNDRDHDRDGRDDDGDGAGARILVARLRVLNSHGDEQPDQGMDFRVAVDRRGNVVSPIQTFQFSDGSVDTFDEVLIKTQTTDARRVSGPVTTGRDDDVVHAGRSNTGVWTGTGNDIVYADKAGTTAYGEGGNDYLAGDRGSDTLDGGWGVDVLDGEDGNDILNDPAGNSALLGDDGNDRISVGAGNGFIAGGEDDDAIATGAGSNVVAFNRGDGLDIIASAAGSTNTLSLGGGVQYSNLRFAQVGNDLTLEVGRRDAITFKDWYADAANPSFVTLQVINRGGSDEDHRSSDPLRDRQIEEFDFGKLVAAFDQARAANPSLTRWNLMNGLLSAHLGGSDGAALGGDLAYQYGMRGDISRMDLGAFQATLADPQFGKSAQTLASER